MRIVRALVGTLLMLAALPTLTTGFVLWEVSRHRDALGAFQAVLEPVRAEGPAIVVSDFDRLLRREAAFARGGRTVLRIDAPGLFIGLAPRADVERYLAGTGWLEIKRVRLARGPLPVDAKAVPPRSEPPAEPSGGDGDGATSEPASTSGVAEPAAMPAGPATGTVALTPPSVGVGGTGNRIAPPAGQPFWRVFAAGERYRSLVFSPSSIRGKGLALVIMNADASSGVNGEIAVAVMPRWLDQTTWGLLILGTVLLLLATLALAWPRPYREIVYVVEPARMTEVATRLGLPSVEPSSVEPPPSGRVDEEVDSVAPVVSAAVTLVKGFTSTQDSESDQDPESPAVGAAPTAAQPTLDQVRVDSLTSTLDLTPVEPDRSTRVQKELAGVSEGRSAAVTSPPVNVRLEWPPPSSGQPTAAPIPVGSD